ncbi:MAG: hypothetical protein Q9227_004129 [Pyrenula ochraceoflavens]
MPVPSDLSIIEACKVLGLDRKRITVDQIKKRHSKLTSHNHRGDQSRQALYNDARDMLLANSQQQLRPQVQRISSAAELRTQQQQDRHDSFVAVNTGLKNLANGRKLLRQSIKDISEQLGADFARFGKSTFRNDPLPDLRDLLIDLENQMQMIQQAYQWIVAESMRFVGFREDFQTAIKRFNSATGDWLGLYIALMSDAWKTFRDQTTGGPRSLRSSTSSDTVTSKYGLRDEAFETFTDRLHRICGDDDWRSALQFAEEASLRKEAPETFGQG